jgi:hypothetical protein
LSHLALSHLALSHLALSHLALSHHCCVRDVGVNISIRSVQCKGQRLRYVRQGELGQKMFLFKYHIV